MTTKLQKLSEAMTRLAAEVDTEENSDGSNPRAWQERVVAVARELDALEPDIAKLRSKAAELDPAKRTYGPAMIAKITALHGSLVSLKKRVNNLYPSVLQAIGEHHRQHKAAMHVLEQPEKASPACQTEQVLPQMTPGATDSERSGLSNGDGKVEAAPAEPTPAAAATDHDDAGSKQVHEPTAPPQEMPDASTTAQAVAPKQREEQERREAALEQQRAGVERQNAASLARLTAMQRRWQGQAARAPVASPDLPDGVPFTVTGGGPELMRILKAVQAVGRSVVVDFNTSWCGPCRAMKPVLSTLAGEYRGKVAVVMVDCEQTPQNRALASEAAVRAFPTFHLYHGMDRKQSFQGGRPLAEFRSMLDQHLHSCPPAAASGASTAAELLGALQQLGSGTSTETELAEACQLLSKILENIRKAPGDAKYRRLKASSRRLKEALLGRPAGPACVAAVGFGSLMEAGEQVYVGDSITVESVNAVLPLLHEASHHPAAFLKFLRLQEQSQHPGTDVGAQQVPGSTGSVLSSGGSTPGGSDARPTPLLNSAPAVSAAQSSEQTNALLAAQLAQLLANIAVPEQPSQNGKQP